VKFRLTTADLAFHNQQMKLVTEPGKFYLWVGPSSAHGLRTEFEVTD